MGKWKKRIMSAVLGAGILTTGCIMEQDVKAETKNQAAGYLAVYVASYEYNMGVEYAQFPSGTYTDTVRTDVLYYGLSRDGKNFAGLNNNKAVYYPKGFHQLGAPTVFRKADGGYGLLASLNNKSDKIFLADSEDLLFFENERVVTLNKKNIVVKNPSVFYDENEQNYKIFWEGGDGNSYVSVTSDFSSFSEAEKTEYKKEVVTASLPSYAAKEEAAIMELTQEEYDRIENKYGGIKSVSVQKPDDCVCREGEEPKLPKSVEVTYSDGSKALVGVDWNTENALDLSNLKEGIYQVNGIIRDEKYNSPLALYRADPFIAYNEEDNMYYLTGSNLNKNSANGGGAYNSIVLRRASTINGLTEAKEISVWTGKNIKMSDTRKDSITGWYWAPELHYIGGKWRIIAMGTVKSTDGDTVLKDGWAQCVFTCEGEDLMTRGNWKYEGYIGNTTDNQPVGAFDTTFFEYNGQCYYVTHVNSQLYITTVDAKDLTKPTGKRIPIAGTDRAFERNLGSGQDIQEGAGVILHGGKVFVTYSCSTVDMHYGICLLYADLKDDLMKTESWHKYQMPLLTTADLTETIKEGVFTKSKTENGQYRGTFGPGHNNFTIDANGNPVLVYHARDWDDSYPGATGENKYGLTDPGRHAYVRTIHFGADGFPVLNMTPEQFISKDMEKISVTLHVEKGTGVSEEDSDKGTPAPTPTVSAGKQDDVVKPGVEDSAGQGKEKSFVVNGKKYSNVNMKKKTVTFAGPKKKSCKALTIPASVKRKGMKYAVTAIAKKACYGCKKLKKIVVKSTKITKVGTDAWKGIPAKAKIKVPKIKLADYRKLFHGKGQKKTVQIIK